MTMPHTRLSRWAHRKGVARAINADYFDGRYLAATVDTALPLAFLARYANHYFRTSHVVRRERIGTWQWRWYLTSTMVGMAMAQYRYHRSIS